MTHGGRERHGIGGTQRGSEPPYTTEEFVRSLPPGAHVEWARPPQEEPRPSRPASSGSSRQLADDAERYALLTGDYSGLNQGYR